MPTAKQRANWARFAKMARARSRAKRASRSSSRRRRASPKRSIMPRRRRTTRRKSTSRSKKSFNIASAAVNANAVLQMVEPFVSAGVIQAIQSKDWPGMIAAIRAGGKEATSAANLLEAAGPVIGYRILKKVASRIGVSSPRIAGIRAF